MANKNETVEQVCEDLEKYICGDDDIVYSLTGDEAIEYKDRFLAAHKRELKAKDAEIASLRSLVKEMADDLSGYLCESECNRACVSFGNCCSQTSRQIIAKARKVVK